MFGRFPPSLPGLFFPRPFGHIALVYQSFCCPTTEKQKKIGRVKQKSSKARQTSNEKMEEKEKKKSEQTSKAK